MLLVDSHIYIFGQAALPAWNPFLPIKKCSNLSPISSMSFFSPFLGTSYTGNTIRIPTMELKDPHNPQIIQEGL